MRRVKMSFKNIIFVKLISKFFNLFKKKNPFDLIKHEFDISVIDKLATKQLNKQKKKLNIKSSEFGNKEKEKYYFHIFRIEKISEFCRYRGWLTKDEWAEHKLLFSDYFKELAIASRDYSDILRQQMKLTFKKRQREYL